MHFMYTVVIIIDRAVRQLQKLIAQCRCTGHTDIAFISRQFQDHLPFQFFVCFFRLGIQNDRHLMINNIRKLQVIFGLHGNADV